MRDADRHAILQGAISTFGGQHQVDRALEELVELMTALLKERRNRDADEYQRLTEDVREEMADVQIMLDQLRLIYGPTDAHEACKLQRLAELVRKHGGTQILGGIDYAAPGTGDWTPSIDDL